jgi:hypothetical protein
MSRSFFVRQLQELLGALSPGNGRKKRRSRARRFTGLEYLEGRALMATINPSAVISSAPASGGDFNYTITLTNSSASTAPIGTFWYAWIAVPFEDFLATNPISVTPPTGWSASVTNIGSSDGYGIEYTANSSASAIQPGSSLNFSFTSADTPSSVNGNSPFYPGTPVGTSVVYQQGSFTTPTEQFVVQPATSTGSTSTGSTSTGSTSTGSTTSTPPVTITGVQLERNKKHRVTEIIIDFSGGLNASEADNVGIYALTVAGKKGSFLARNAKHLAIGSATYDAALNTVTILPRKAFALTKPVQLLVHGQAPGGLQDSSGQFIDGNDIGQAGDDGVFVLKSKGVVRE